MAKYVTCRSIWILRILVIRWLNGGLVSVDTGPPFRQRFTGILSYIPPGGRGGPDGLPADYRIAADGAVLVRLEPFAHMIMKY